MLGRKQVYFKRMKCMQLLKFTESKYKPNVGEIFSQYRITWVKYLVNIEYRVKTLYRPNRIVKKKSIFCNSLELPINEQNYNFLQIIHLKFRISSWPYKLFGHLATGRVNIRIHRDITGEMWFGVGQI